MRIAVRCRIASFLLICLCVLSSLLPTSAQQQQVLGSIIGHIRLTRGGVPPQAVMVTLEFRGAAIGSVYSDSQGTFGFHSLGPSPYTVTVSDDQYEPVRKPVTVEANSLTPMVFVDIALVPKASAKISSDAVQQPSGANPNMIDVHEYSERFPKPAVKEFEKGLSADGAGKRDEAIRHYQKAVAIAPEFYLAHNNLGSDYLSKSDFPNARKEFERVVQLNQSDATAYFNLSNVCMLMSELPQAQQYLDEGIRRQPDAALGQFLLGSLSIRLGKLSQAEVALRRAIQLSPVLVQARLKLVNLLLQQGRNQDAVAQLHDFLDAFPNGSYSTQARQVLQRLEAPAKAGTAVSN
jgi:Flp pilus assembly protein TadD